ncbi:prevent-host-death protein [Sorangium cellulosum]|uniref:Prevent-host-death protein n=1 Tax=Sorangium cellulosum TaxID=56 RepID=A0A2L0EUB6_SORCE|nr:prevent-host-death protein [Sorangium cellulosum]AUX42881.1 prevent-host-death protein [Sorangium cellulosum]
MATVRIEEIQQDLRGYLRRVAAGETLVVLESSQPVAEIRPVTTPARGARPAGLCAGEFTVPEGFDAALPEDLLDSFEGR